VDKDLLEKLCKPFPVDMVEWKPGVKTKDGTAALGLAYVEMREYENRADEVLGPDNWTVDVQFHTVADRVVFVSQLTAMGVSRSQVGEAMYNFKDNKPNENAVTTAYAQAVKRAWSSLGLGRYLYNIPSVWAEYDNQKKRFTDAAINKLRSNYTAYLNSEPIDTSPLGLTTAHIKERGVDQAVIEDTMGKTLDKMTTEELRTVFKFVDMEDRDKAMNILALAVGKGASWDDAVTLYETEYNRGDNV